MDGTYMRGHRAVVLRLMILNQVVVRARDAPSIFLLVRWSLKRPEKQKQEKTIVEAGQQLFWYYITLQCQLQP